ncbi:MAG TPA: hypothetical protein VFQ53_31245 [Kofleriaceae bacterium]|nr:hypothetical protein [Kofleriaceae bacterium]
MAGADAPSKKTLTQRPNLLAAQKLAAQARAKLVLGAAEFDADGHAERAMKLLTEVNAELAAAVKAPDAAPK